MLSQHGESSLKQYLLFAGREDTNLKGVHGVVGDFDSFAEAFVALVDRQTPSEWWHILDSKTGEVVERQHLKVHNGMIGFERSAWIAGQPAQEEPIAVTVPASSPSLPRAIEEKVASSPAPGPAIAIALPKAADLSALEADLRSTVTSSLKNGHATGAANGKANGHANGVSAEH